MTSPTRLELPSQAGLVRRTDVVLRSLYPHLATRIFEVEPHRYLLFFEREQLDAASIAEHFDHHISPVAVWLNVSNQLPTAYVQEIQPIHDNELSRGFEGFSFSSSDVINILISKFPDLPLPHRHSPNQNNPITFAFKQQLTPKQEQQVRAVLNGILPGWPIAFAYGQEEPAPISPTPLKHPIDVDIDVKPHRLRPKAPLFVRDDEAFWFNNVDQIFDGCLPPGAIPGAANAGMACYIDASVAKQIDLRQALLMYDTIFFAPPIMDGTRSKPSFWEEQHVSQSDALRLIEAGRLRLILTQPEERTVPDFLHAAHERDPHAVIGRLTAAGIIASDLVQTADDYLLARADLRPQVGKLAYLLAEERSLPAEAMSQLLLWPLHARRRCLAGLMHRGLMGIPTFSQGAILAKELKATTGRDLELEALMSSNGVHVAHALNATFIPPLEDVGGWIILRKIVGDRLNFYRSFTASTASCWAGNEWRKQKMTRVLPPVPLFDFEKRAPIEDMIAITSQRSVRRKGRALVSRLSELPEDEREAEIDRIAQEFYELGARRERRNLHLDVVNDSIDVVAAVADLSIFPFKSAWNLLTRCISLARRSPALDALADTIEENIDRKTGRNSDLDFLSKISRVAEIRDDGPSGGASGS